MQITIKYLPTDDGLPPMTETLTSPWKKEWDHVRCQFTCHKGDLESEVERKHLWLLRVDHLDRKSFTVADIDTGDKKTSETNNPPDSYHLLARNCWNVEEYIEWLEDTVMYVALDGEVFWENIPYRKAQEEAEKAQKEAAAEPDKEDEDMLDVLFG